MASIEPGPEARLTLRVAVGRLFDVGTAVGEDLLLGRGGGLAQPRGAGAGDEAPVAQGVSGETTPAPACYPTLPDLTLIG